MRFNIVGFKKMRLLLLPISFFGACAGQGQTDDSGLQKQHQAAEISAKCGLPQGTLLVRNGALRLRPKLDESYQKIDCALTELQKRGLVSDLPKAFVGNERYDENLQ